MARKIALTAAQQKDVRRQGRIDGPSAARSARAFHRAQNARAASRGGGRSSGT